MSSELNEFPTAENEAAAAGLDAGDDDDDFGGFEVADPLPTELAQSEASPSPWATLSGGAQPDLLFSQSSSSQPQGMVQQQPPAIPGLEPVFSSPPPQGHHQSHPRDPAGASSHPAEFGDYDEPTFVAQPGPEIGAATAAATKPSFIEDLQTTNDAENPVMAAGSGASQPEVTSQVGSSSVLSGGDMPSGSTNGGCGPDPSRIVADPTQSSEELRRLEDKLQVSEKVKFQLQLDVESMREKSQSLERALSEQTVALEEQQQRYRAMEARHGKQLEELRKAGHDSLALIVEEYKELSKVAVLQQQESSEREFQSKLKEEAASCQSLLKSEHDRLMQLLEEERQEMEREAKRALEQGMEAHQTQLSRQLEEGSLREKEMIEKAVQGAVKSTEVLLQKELEAERAKFESLLAEQKADFMRLMREEQEKGREAIEKAVVEEKRNSQAALKQSLIDQRKQHEEGVAQTADRIRREMADYLNEQKKGDDMVQQKSLAALDLFLESARQQLKFLIQDQTTTTDT